MYFLTIIESIHEGKEQIRSMNEIIVNRNCQGGLIYVKGTKKELGGNKEVCLIHVLP